MSIKSIIVFYVCSGDGGRQQHRLVFCNVNRLLTLVAPSCILAVKTDLQHTEDMRPVTAIPKAQETEGFKLRGLAVVFCDVIRQGSLDRFPYSYNILPNFQNEDAGC